MKTYTLTLALLAGVSAIHAQSTLVVPNDREFAAGPGTFLGPFSSSQRTYQWLIHASQLTSFVGKSLNGLSFRSLSSETAAWPAADTTFNNFELYLSGSVDPSARSLTFANNVVGARTQVRSGPLTVAAGALPLQGSTFQFGTPVDFSAYLYNGGNLLIELRHTGSTGTSRSLDAMLATGGATLGYGSLFSACWTSSYTGTSGSQANFTIIKLRAAGVSTIGGTIAFSNFVGTQAGRVLSVIVRDSTTQTVALSTTDVLDASGNWSVDSSSVAAGTYDIYLDSPPFLRKKLATVSVTGSGASSLTAALSNGDSDSSGEVDAADIDAVIAAFGATEGGPGYTISVDVDGSSEVDAADIDIVIANFGSTDE